MATIGQPERITQNRVTALFREELGYEQSVNGVRVKLNSAILHPDL